MGKAEKGGLRAVSTVVPAVTGRGDRLSQFESPGLSGWSGGEVGAGTGVSNLIDMGKEFVLGVEELSFRHYITFAPGFTVVVINIPKGNII